MIQNIKSPLLLILILSMLGCTPSKESQINSFVKKYNSLQSEIIKGNGFVDTKSTFMKPNTINIDVIIKSGNKVGIKNFLSKYEPQSLTKALEYVADPLKLLEQDVVFNFNFFKANNELLLSKAINLETYKKYKSEQASKTNANINHPFYLNILNKELKSLNHQLPLNSNNITFQKISRDEKDYLVYKCSCTNTS
ncbi:MAG TPA: hypothetical protein PKD85_03310, partial [Saprospiraceae bacterium]|nr:hypothetical protein [Saprospiraceae bacterium]